MFEDLKKGSIFRMQGVSYENEVTFIVIMFYIATLPDQSLQCRPITISFLQQVLLFTIGMAIHV